MSANIQVRNPATLELIHELPVARQPMSRLAVARGRQAQSIWQQTSFAERAQILYRLRDLLLDEGEKLADILTAETGRPRAEVYGNELFYLCDAIGTWAKNSCALSSAAKNPAELSLAESQKSLLHLSTARRDRHHQPVELSR